MTPPVTGCQSVSMSDIVADAVWMVRGAWVSMALRAGCLLGVFDALGERRTADAVAAAVDADSESVARYLRFLVDLRLLDHDDSGFLVTELGATFRSDHPARVRDLVLMQTDLPSVAAWHALDDALRTGAGTYRPVNGLSHWEHLSAHPEEERIFNAAMARRGTVQAGVLLASGVLEGVSTVVDVGGGRGAMVAALLAERPDLQGVVADRPAVAQEATALLAAQGLGDRGRGVGCDFFASVPSGGDAYTMGHVLHDWTDDECVAILGRVRDAMAADARLLVLERVVDAPDRGPVEQRDLHLMDLHMLVLFGARERTRAEYDALLVAAGFETPRLVATGDWNVLEARLPDPPE